MSNRDLLQREENAVYDGGEPGWYKPFREGDFQENPSASNKSLDSEAINDAEDGFSPPPLKKKRKKTKQKLSSRFSTKQKVAASASGGFLTGGIIGFFALIATPLQLMHLGQILGIPSATTSSFVSVRYGDLFRNNRAIATGEVGETRIGRAGSRIFANAEARMNNAGIEINRDSGRFGRPTAIRIDSTRHPDYSRLPSGEARTQIARHYGINPNQVTDAGGGRYTISMTDRTINQQRALLHSTIGQLNDGRVKTAMNFRVMAKYFGVPSLFRPYQRALASAEQDYSTRAARRQAERDRKSTKSPQMRAKYVNALERTRDRVSANSRAVSSALFVAGAVCVAKDIAGFIPLVNYSTVVAPSMLEAADKQAIDSQIMYSDDFSNEQLAATTESFEDEDGNTIWQAKALRALERGGSGGGEDLDENYRQAFSADASAGGILGAIDDNVVGDIACSPLGRATQFVVGGLLLLVPGPGWMARGAAGVGSAALAAGVIGYVSDLIVDGLTEDYVDAFAGPQGGNLLAYGAMAGNNLNARSMGGVALSEEQTAALRNHANQLEREELQQKSFFARTFDLSDHRSLVSTALRSTQPSINNSAPTSFASLLNPGNLLGSVSSSLTQTAFANEEPYDWGFPVYGVSLDTLNNSTYTDPYENADIAAELLDGENGEEYINRAKDCFGVEITRDNDGLWFTKKEHETNPVEDEYIDANCDDQSTEWTRIRLFVLDDSIINTVLCYEGDNASCADIGMGGSTRESETSQEAGSQIVGDPYADGTDVACAEGTNDLGTTIGYVDGQEFDIRLCSLPNIPSIGRADNPGDTFSTPGAEGYAIVNSRVSGAWFSLAEDAASAGIRLQAFSSFRSMEHQTTNYENSPSCPGSNCLIARPGYSSHQAGVAIDFENGMRGVTGGGTCDTRARAPSSDAWVWLRDNAESYGFKQLAFEAWHWDAYQSPNRCGADD